MRKRLESLHGQTLLLGSRWWVQFLVYPRRQVPLTERGRTQEVEFPWRTGQCRVFRAPFTRYAVAFGHWVAALPRTEVDGEEVFRMREVPDWRSVVGVPQKSDGSSGR